MSKICDAALTCPFAPEQTTVGCPCSETCPGFASAEETSGGIWFTFNTNDSQKEDAE